MGKIDIFMDKLNFYFTGPFEGHYRWSETENMNQSFLKENISKRFANANFVDSHFEKIAKHLEPFYESGKENLKTDISGIIVPIHHGDISDYFHIAVSISGDFEKDLGRIWKSNGIYQEHPGDEDILKKRANLTYDFMRKTFNIPVFESHKFLPGYRNVPLENENLSPEQRISYVENSFNSWLDKNFKN